MNKKMISIFVALGVLLCIVGISLFIKTSKPTTYEVTFMTSGGTKVPTQQVEKGKTVKKPEDPTKEGYIFIEWLNNGKSYNFNNKVTSNLILTASWEKEPEGVESYVVKFNTDGGTTIANQIIEKGKLVTKPNDPSKEGYIFKGWTLNNQDYDFNTPIDKSIELNANWEKIKVTNNKNNANNTNKNNNSNSSNSNNNNNSSNNNSTPTPTVKKYTVNFDSNGGSTVASQTIIEGNKAIKPSSPTKLGYTFNSWKLNNNTYNFDTAVTKDITLVAEWELKKYNITYNLNGGKQGVHQTSYTINSGSFMINDPSKDGYSFECWNVHNDSDSNVYSPQKDLTISIKQIDSNTVKLYIEGYTKSYNNNNSEWIKYSKESTLGNLHLEAVWRAN